MNIFSTIAHYMGVTCVTAENFIFLSDDFQLQKSVSYDII